ncbi:hypothetical protein HMPREF9727_00756 [Treponema denticola MYR-T]|uniref:ABC transmembrane type-1 domain-containing protein n=1 Tax=Treponema denticola H1-T TaxID=999431 RepID=M2C198_TREDN|nr:ABC transporter permease [Treponema denticola]EMB29916.1 hypothetical protein HMPREF9727_00756 [Treponema denticola MYR-T]EMB31072.1 hypothetical protein HMPREF9725_01121 [Treponema denticola H1-T]
MKFINNSFTKAWMNRKYKLWILLFGVFSFLVVYIKYLIKKFNKSSSAMNQYTEVIANVNEELQNTNTMENLLKESYEQVVRKNEYFKKVMPEAEILKEAEKNAKKRYNELYHEKIDYLCEHNSVKKITFLDFFLDTLKNPVFLILSIIISFPMYVLLYIYTRPIQKYILERLFMMVFVIFGVTFMVFTILYFSPMDPAVNILGQTATPEQIEEFNRVYGLNASYFSRLFTTFKSLVTFDLGITYVGNMSVSTEIATKFPITLTIAFCSVFIAVLIAIPAGIMSAIKQYSSFDYTFMFFALIGLSIPNFWLALLLILQFSIKMSWLPATYIVGNWQSLIMPAVVLGTGMSATVARMTRSSMLEVKHSDYILTARAKGLSPYRVTIKHILGNAMIPIITVIGLQFGALLGGSAVTEKSFNIRGLGSFIVDRQFIPDVPVVLAGVVYIAVVISVVNLMVDILYAMLDPRIKSKIKNS